MSWKLRLKITARHVFILFNFEGKNKLFSVRSVLFTAFSLDANNPNDLHLHLVELMEFWWEQLKVIRVFYGYIYLNYI